MEVPLIKIQQACEKVIKESGHGVVTIKIKNKAVYLIEATSSELLDSKPK